MTPMWAMLLQNEQFHWNKVFILETYKCIFFSLWCVDTSWEYDT